MYGAVLRAIVADDSIIPPTTGWEFYNFDRYPFRDFNQKAYEADPLLICNSSLPSPYCSITVSLSGLAKEFQGECEGEYKDTGLRSAGRKVTAFQFSTFPQPKSIQKIIFFKAKLHFSKK